jgi:hypothetical protein
VSERGGLRKFFHRLAADERALQAEELRGKVAELGATPVRQCGERQEVCVAGTLRTVTLRPRAGAPALDCELWDGSGTVNLVWLGRRRIAGIEPGRQIVARGRLTDADGRPTIFNPVYELVAPAEA